MPSPSQPKFVELRTYLRNDDPTWRVDFYIDTEGMFYFRKLVGTDDAGPFTFSELTKELDLKPAPWKTTKLET